MPPELYSCFSGILFWDNVSLYNNIWVALFLVLLQEKRLKLTEIFCRLQRKHKLSSVYVGAKGNCYAYNCAGEALPFPYMSTPHFKIPPLSWANLRYCKWRWSFLRSGSKTTCFIVSIFSSSEFALLKQKHDYRYMQCAALTEYLLLKIVIVKLMGIFAVICQKLIIYMSLQKAALLEDLN